MARLELRIAIDATPEQVWPVLADFEGQKRWMVDLRSLEMTSAVKQGVGARMKVTSELFGLPLVKDDMVVDYWQEPQIYSVIHIGMFSGTGYFELKPIEGGTELTWVEIFRPPFGPLGERGFDLVVGPHLRRVFMRSLSNVKRLAEEAAATAD
jgi:carbon monoxide dehydrogenase subunit G